MALKTNLDETLARLRDFWNREKPDRVPIRIRIPAGSLQAHESYLAQDKEAATQIGSRWEDVVLDQERYFDFWERLLLPVLDLEDDSVPTVPTDLGPALMAGIMGAEIIFENGTSWTAHPLKDWSQAQRYRFRPDIPWLLRVSRMTRYFLERSRGRFAVGLANYMGPADILTALRGPTQTCMDFYEFPAETRALLESCTDAYLKAIESQMNMVYPYRGGTCDPYMYWTIGRGYWLTCDVSSVLSPEIYREHLREFDQRIVSSMETCWMHVHSGSTFMVDEFIELDGLKGVQIVNDAPAGPALHELLPLLQRIQKNHCLILRKYGISELMEILPELSPAGLLVDTQCRSREEADKALSDWSRYTRTL